MASIREFCTRDLTLYDRACVAYTPYGSCMGDKRLKKDLLSDIRCRGVTIIIERRDSPQYARYLRYPTRTNPFQFRLVWVRQDGNDLPEREEGDIAYGHGPGRMVIRYGRDPAIIHTYAFRSNDTLFETIRRFTCHKKTFGQPPETIWHNGVELGLCELQGYGLHGIDRPYIRTELKQLEAIYRDEQRRYGLSPYKVLAPINPIGKAPATPTGKPSPVRDHESIFDDTSSSEDTDDNRIE